MGPELYIYIYIYIVRNAYIVGNCNLTNVISNRHGMDLELVSRLSSVYAAFLEPDPSRGRLGPPCTEHQRKTQISDESS